MNFWEFLGSRHQQLLADAYQHASAVFQCMVVATLLGVLIGVLTYRSEWAGNLATLGTSTILTIPSLAMIGLLIPIVGLGVPPTVTALTLYGLLPIVRNSIVGLRGVDPALVDAAKGIGMSRTARLLKVELPLAWPPILTGIRVSTQMLMGIAAIAAYASGPGSATRSSAGSPRWAARTPSIWCSRARSGSSSWRCCSTPRTSCWDG